MIICPKCKEEIEDGSHFCDQCGTQLHYCNRCGRVGLGRRCTSCGGLMVDAADIEKSISSQQGLTSQVSMEMISHSYISNAGMANPMAAGNPNIAQAMTTLTLVNGSLGIRIEGQNGAVIGRRQGPYAQYFQNNMYVSGVHAQLHYNSNTGWCIVDMHSSNGTRLNGHPLQPDMEMSLKDGDIVMIANVNLQVSIS